MTTLAGKTVLLTGASGRIGVLIARALAREKATVVNVSHLDISNVEELSILVEQINQFAGSWESIDILINNATLVKYRAFQDYTLKDLQSVLATNLLVGMELTRLVLPSMLSRGSGHIVNIASLAGKKGSPYNSIYSASKAGLITWSDAIRQELVNTGVGLSLICPGYVSQAGMFFGVPAPNLAGTSPPTDVANAVLRAIKQNKAEVIVNQGAVRESITRVMLAIGQLSPSFGDAVYRWLGVAKLNQMRAKNQMQAENLFL
jgi:short-subunit dehydrogenase